MHPIEYNLAQRSLYFTIPGSVYVRASCPPRAQKYDSVPFSLVVYCSCDLHFQPLSVFVISGISHIACLFRHILNTPLSFLFWTRELSSRLICHSFLFSRILIFLPVLFLLLPLALTHLAASFPPSGGLTQQSTHRPYPRATNKTPDQKLRRSILNLYPILSPGQAICVYLAPALMPQIPKQDI